MNKKNHSHPTFSGKFTKLGETKFWFAELACLLSAEGLKVAIAVIASLFLVAKMPVLAPFTAPTATPAIWTVLI